MTWRNKIIWSEGMFLRPHHFQQHDRYLENLLESRCAPLRAYGWGIRELSIDQDLLTQGKLSVSRCKGVLPDGTPFDIPGEDTPPPILEIPENTHDTLIHLALPARRQGAVEADRNDIPEVLARFLPREQEVDDSQVSLRPRERFWDIPVPKIDSAFDSLFVPRPSRSLALRDNLA
ncbi:MAG: type VI secretion system baseplate subunit TssK, partial [gamma proteobacterium endosymbiont of Lamellibrachia anaximandri]|nr:type VI secretion system baseplate subunit TssK [gamma proteobacterium endosymbiont of Lamellibrachia anaximandri]